MTRVPPRFRAGPNSTPLPVAPEQPVRPDPLGALAVLVVVVPLLVLVIVGTVWSWRAGVIVLASLWLAVLLWICAAHLGLLPQRLLIRWRSSANVRS